jgi:L-glutamine:2-deoxy-scyllo-inosose/3-amino-2,3-dideoxy-scyllo-inosose aminotransferase
MGEPADLALLGGRPVFSEGWTPWPSIEPETIEAVREALSSGRWAVSGFQTRTRTLDMEFAQRFGEYLGVPYCVAFDHGSNALLAALHALDLDVGVEVIVPGLTWVATASAAVRAGLVPVLADIDRDSLCIDPAAVEGLIGSRTAAIVAVHLYCSMGDMDRLQAIARRHGLALIEDAAQAHGAEWRGRRAGGIGTIGAFSMQQGKALTSGEGEAAVTSDAALADRLEILRGDGRRYQPAGQAQVGWPDLEEVGIPMGWNMHLTEMQAALLLDGLRKSLEELVMPASSARSLSEHE